MKNAIPLLEAMPTLAELDLPKPIPADQIVCDMEAIGSIAGWGCFQREVIFETFTEDQNAIDFDIRPSPLAPPDLPVNLAKIQEAAMHSRPQLIIQFGVNYLQGGSDNPAAWAGRLNRAVVHGLRDASHFYLTKSPASLREAEAWGYSTVIAEFLTGIVLSPSPVIIGSVAAGTVVAANVAKAWAHYKAERPQKEGCYSFIPGLHYDRLGMIYASTRRRWSGPGRLVQQIK